MSDLISRQAAAEEISKLVSTMSVCVSIDECRGMNSMKRRAIKAVEDLPSAQPERKVGKWIIHPEIKNIYGGTYIECSECREKYVVQYIEDEKFCRNCGADMRGEEKDDQ